MAPTRVAWVGLGCNVGVRYLALISLRSALVGLGLEIEAASRELLTRPLGALRQGEFLNQVIRVGSSDPLPAGRWLELCDTAASLAGRRPTYRWGPRRADADILLLGDRGEVRVAGGGLEVPHPRLGDRAFNCALLAELDPGLVHPDGWRIATRGGPFLEADP